MNSLGIKNRVSRFRLEQHTKIFASMCPDEILDHYDTYETREYQTTLLLGDISGFTDLTEKYTKTGVGGPSKLSETLNSYIGAMVQEILSHNGDVVKFSGDAFIVMWKLQKGILMRDIATEAMQTACVIQKHFGTYETDVGVTLKVKLAIASGKTYFTSIGDPETLSYYVITGKPVWDVKFAEGLCRGGDILVVSSSWQWANPNEYIYESLPDGKHTLIIACSAMWYQSKTQDIQNDIEDENEDLDRDYTLFDAEPSSITLTDQIDDNFKEHDFEQVDYSLRPKVIKAAKARLKDALRSYIPRPVIRSVELDEPLEHLTEMRQVVILFINVITANVYKERLISLVNKTYRLVCELVNEMHGCVNKTSLFDKDLLFLCVFGLRGDKHELESQIGLRCASRLRQDLLAMSNIKSVTIAVTTGMTYCGVIGHVLRREYTVIGMSVNKAARLMVAYNNKVVCDRESFLHSRLEAKHFILQEPRHLKGITNVGPVYEFQEQINNYPLLGREAEIKVFQEMLTNMIEYFIRKRKMQQLKLDYNKLIIKGEPRIGKTRLLDEIAQDIPTDISYNYISLMTNDAKASYNLIHMIFSKPLNFHITTSPREREERLMSELGQIREPEFLCVLNQPFNVHFAMSQHYTALSMQQKRKMLKKFLLKLLKNCFKELWVMIIDDIQYGDNESMLLFPTLTRRNIFFVLSIGHKFGEEYEMHPGILKKAQIVELSYIDKWYHAALACQFLQVYGIPPELEKLIQEKSFGNPGWIESYLVSLTQSGSILIVHIRKTIAEEMGYNGPIALHLQRVEIHKSDAIDNEEKIAVCKFAKDYVPEETDAEMTMDVMILKLFDSLTPLDQLLLKCASVLGEIVNRDMLRYLMADKSIREIGLAIQKLFEIRIFGCAGGDFTTSGRPLVFYRNIKKISRNTEIECDCIGLIIQDELIDLPRYASCGLIHFKMSMFRETTYRSLTENQKIELHSKALKFLQRHVRRCMACGELQFEKLLGKSVAQEIKRRRATIELPKTYQLEKVTYTLKREDADKDMGEEKSPLCAYIFRKIRKPIKTFSNVDFTNCQCHLILTTVYAQILDHCQGIGKPDMILMAILEFVEICLADNNVPQARRLLDDAEVVLQQIFETHKEESIFLSYINAKIQTLQGRCHLESGLLSEANKKLNDAMNSLGYYFPEHNFSINLKSTIQLELLRWKLICPKPWRIDIVDELTINYIEQLATCLAQMFEVFRGTKGMKKHARLAAIWSLNAALESSRDFLTLCTSFTNMMLIAHVYQKSRSVIPYLEKQVLDICAKKGDFLELQELKGIAEVYAGVFFSRWLRGEINRAIRIGFIVTRMAQTMDSIFLKTLILPRLAHLLMLSRRHSEVVVLLRELEFASKNDLEKSSRTWYYAICADIQLDTGITILSFQNCEQYYLQEGESIISLRDPEAERRYFTSMWLWFIKIKALEILIYININIRSIRTEQWEAMIVWNSRNVTAESMVDEHKVAATITALKKLEGLLLLYVREVTNRNINAVNTMMEIKNIFKYIQNMVKIVKIAIPRYMLMKAYYYMIQSRKSAAVNMLQRTKKLSMKVDNKMIYTWANHCQQNWMGAMSSIHEDLWKEKTIELDYKQDDININESVMVPFTFPLPKFSF
ncbi:adenylate cyclase type 10-like [Cataglyphis hispanica]|uniref:adenylate cyclase type 10-like n=1 Tax=Cataglyphis hispanica TaxID=1086592 RepID=UPI00217FDFD4|nr:adenylate cyclase type 10-like [Cataglyphis hispanica]